MSEQIERAVILDVLRPLGKSGLRCALRRLPPPGGGWLIHVKESDLQEIPGTRRENLLVDLAGAVNDLNAKKIPVGIIRTLE